MILRSVFVGKARKSAGDMTTTTDKAGRTIARQKPTVVRNPNTAAQQTQRRNFARAQTFSKYASKWFSSVVLLAKPYWSGFNAFTSYLLGLGVTATTTVEEIAQLHLNYAGSKLYSGNPEIEAGSVNINVAGNTEFILNWEETYPPGSSGNDILRIVIFDPNTGIGQIYSVEATREDGTMEVSVPDAAAGQEFIVVTYFQNPTTGEVSPGYAKLWFNDTSYGISNSENA